MLESEMPGLDPWSGKSAWPLYYMCKCSLQLSAHVALWPTRMYFVVLRVKQMPVMPWFFWHLIFQCDRIPQPKDMSSVCFPWGRQVQGVVGRILRCPQDSWPLVYTHLLLVSQWNINQTLMLLWRDFAILICSKSGDLKADRWPGWACLNHMNSLDLGLAVREIGNTGRT